MSGVLAAKGFRRLFMRRKERKYPLVMALKVFSEKRMGSAKLKRFVKDGITRTQLATVRKMLDEGQDQYDCMKSVCLLFNFERAFVDDLTNEPGDFDFCKSGLFASIVAWIYIEADSDAVDSYYVVMFDAVMRQLESTMDRTLLLSLSMLAVHAIESNRDSVHEAGIERLCTLVSSCSDGFYEDVVPLLGAFLYGCYRLGAGEIATTVKNTLMELMDAIDDEKITMVDISYVVRVCDLGLRALDTEYIMMFARIAGRRVEQGFVEIYEWIPTFIAERVLAMPCENLSELPVKEVEPVVQSPASTVSLDEGLSPIPVSVFEVDTSVLLSDEQRAVLSALKPIWSLSCAEYRTAYVTSFAQVMEDEAHASIRMTLMVCLIRTTTCECDCSAFFDALDPVFDPQYTIFSTRNELLHVMRQYLFDRMMTNGSKSLSLVLERASRSPVLFAEMIGRAHAKLNYIDLSALCTPNMVEYLAKNLVRLHSESSEPGHQAWSTVFMFVLTILEDMDTVQKFLTHSVFTNYFFGLVVKESLRSIVFRAIQRFMSKAVSCETIIKFCLDMFDNWTSADHVEILVLFVSKLNDSLNLNVSHVPDFVALAHRAVRYIVCHPLNTVMISCLGLFATVCMNIESMHLTDWEVVSLCHALRTIEQSDEGSSVLTAMLARRKSVNFMSSFLIQDYRMIVLLLCYCKVKAVIEFIHGLCAYSAHNAKQCHVGRLDLFLIAVFSNNGNSFTFDGIVFQVDDIDHEFIGTKIMPLLSMISEAYCSPAVALEFIKVAVPSADGTFPVMAEFALNAYSSLLDKMQRNPVPQYEFSGKSEAIFYDDVKFDLIENGFVFVGWLRVDVPMMSQCTGNPLVFAVRGSGNSSIVVFIKGATLYVQFTTSEGVPWAITFPGIENGRWQMISFLYREQSDDSSQVAMALDAEPAVVFVVRNPGFTESNVVFQVGGIAGGTNVGSLCSYIGPYRIMNKLITQQERVTMFTHSLWAEGITGDFLPEPTPTTKPNVAEKVNSMLSVVTEDNLSMFLLPFLIFSPTAPRHFIERVIDVLGFVVPNLNYRVIRRIMRGWDSTTLKYSIYIKYASLLDTMEAIDLLKYVILDISIWSKMTPSDLGKTIMHWSQMLFVVHSKLLKEAIDFRDLLEIVVFIIHTAASSDMDAGDADALRRGAVQLLASYHAIIGGSDDYKYVLGRLCEVSERVEALVFLKVLREIGTPMNASEMQFVFSNTDPDVFCEALETMILLDRENAGNNVDQVMSDLTSIHVTQELFEKLCELIPQYAIVVLPTMMVSFFLDGAAEKLPGIWNSLLADNAALGVLVHVRNWYVWLIMATLRLSPGQQSSGIAFLHSLYERNKSPKMLDRIMGLVDVVDVSGLFETNYFACMFLKLVCDVDYSLGKGHDTSKFLQRCFRFMFYSFHRRSNIVSMFPDSPYGKLTIQWPSDYNLDDSCSVIDKPMLFLAAMLKKAGRADLKMIFCPPMKADGSGFVMDDLMVSIFNIISEFKMSDRNEFSFLSVLLYFNKRKEMKLAEKKSYMIAFNNRLSGIGTVMAVTYNNMFVHMIGEMVSDVKKSIGSHEAHVETMRAEFGKLYRRHQKEREDEQSDNEASMEREWGIFICEYMNPLSTWVTKYSRDFELTRKSFKISGSFTVPYLKYEMRRPVDAVVPTYSHIVKKLRATLVRFDKEVECTVVMDKEKIVLEMDGTNAVIIWVSSIYRIFKKVRDGTCTAIEIVTHAHREYFLDFGVEIDAAMQALRSIAKPKLVSTADANGRQEALSARWVNGKIATFAYLTELNLLSGRSYNNKKMYPIYPLPVRDGKLRDFEKYPPLQIDTSIWTRCFEPFGPAHAVGRDGFLQTLEGDTELCAEFFCCFECFTGLGFPSFCKNKYEFVYYLRGFLESDAISRTVHRWIGSIFGINHAERRFQTPEKKPFSNVTLPKFASVVFVRDAFVVLTESGSVTTVDFDGTQRKLTKLNGSNFICHTKSEFFVVEQSNDGDSLSYSIGCNTMKTVKLGFRVKSVSPGFSMIAFWTTDKEIVVMRPPGIISRFRLVLEELNCMNPSSRYGLIVVGTKSGKLCAFCASTGNVKFTVDLGGRIPYHVAVTRGFGFIIVHSHRHLAVFTINGEKICESVLDYDIASWCPYVNDHDFDFMAACDREGNVFSLEVFNLQKSQTLWRSRDTVVAICYDSQKRGIVAATSAGQGRFIGYEARETVPFIMYDLAVDD